MVAARRTPAHDLAVVVQIARVGPVDRHRLIAGIGADGAVIVERPAARVVGEAAIGLGRGRVDGDPLGAVHRGGVDGGARHPGEDGDLRLGHAGGGGQKRHPLAGLVIVEHGHEQRAVDHQAGGVAAFHVGLGADPLVHVLAALIVAHVDHETAIRRDRVGRVLVLEAAESGVLDRGRGRVGGVDFHDVARAMRLVGVLADVPAAVPLVVVVAPAFGRRCRSARSRPDAGRHRVMGLRGRPEVAVEVFLAGQVGAPGRPARAAVVHRAERGSCRSGRPRSAAIRDRRRDRRRSFPSVVVMRRL
jgi:hypothetical protein